MAREHKINPQNLIGVFQHTRYSLCRELDFGTTLGYFDIELNPVLSSYSQIIRGYYHFKNFSYSFIWLGESSTIFQKKKNMDFSVLNTIVENKLVLMSPFNDYMKNV